MLNVDANANSCNVCRCTEATKHYNEKTEESEVYE